MSVSFTLQDLLEYSDFERRKWHDWFLADTKRVLVPFQPGERFATFGAMLDHIFLVERRHLARLHAATPPETSGIPHTDAAALFEYGDLVRADFRQFVAGLDEESSRRTLEVNTASGTATLTRRKLLMHVVIHETRHFAQVAFAARAAGHVPPGRHDVFFSPAAFS